MSKVHWMQPTYLLANAIWIPKDFRAVAQNRPANEGHRSRALGVRLEYGRLAIKTIVREETGLSYQNPVHQKWRGRFET